MKESSKSKGKLWLWVLGWIFIFPVPLTILILRSEKLNKNVKYGVIIAGWLIYVAIIAFVPQKTKSDNTDKSTSISNQTGNTTKSLEKNNTNSSEEPSPSPKLEIQSLELLPEKNELILGESTFIDIKSNPEGITANDLVWESSNVDVASVSEGKVTANAGGTTTITAIASNGVRASIGFVIDGSKRIMNLNISKIRLDSNNIGKEWSSSYSINGEVTTGGVVTLTVGEKLSLYARISENDEKPDVGEKKTSYTITEKDLINGFEVDLNVDVEENAGKNAGLQANWKVIYSFKP